MLLVFIFIYEHVMKCLVVIMIAVAFYVSGEILQREGHCILSYTFIQNFSKIYRMVVPISIWYLWFIESKNTVFYKFLFFTYLATKVYVLLLPIKKLFKGGKNLWHRQFSFGRYSTQQELDEFTGKCSICIDQFVNPVTLNPCNHIFCENCITQ
ncbi:hypothetical protein M0812_29927 [Anaeramoeba flamelloides]|uniref:RING-type domain-containing protein n=1 Tax=Anaeramoeba flamelloides TaxID=1746091 RepID=A0AAV7Y0Y6_9EUKA|nr:hypothetical protein M0812_29927 [Anaeramoeba flamelloides]